MAEKANEFMRTWGALVTGFVNIVLLSGVIGFGVWTVKEIGALRVSMAENNSWHVSHASSVEVEKRNMRLEIGVEVERMMRALIEKYEGKIDLLRQDVRTTDMEVRSANASVKALQDIISQMSLRFSSLTADVRQALIDNDFERNAAKKGP